MKLLSLFLALILFSFLNGQQVNLELFAQGLNQPVELTHAGDDRIFVAQQTGQIRIINAEGEILPQPFLDISNLTTASGERGLLGLAFDPDYAENGYFYINYTNQAQNTVVARYSVSDDPNIAATQGEILLTVNQPYGNHNGGCLRFGPDGYLYISMGDGGSAGDPQNNGQNINTLLGKMLRIDVSSGSGYTIPSDNPFFNANGSDEIWAYGLRNAWKFSFDAAQNEIRIADVGQGEWEEINRMPADEAGLNYGWRCYEGNESYNLNNCGASANMVFPVAVYNHQNGRCSITGGFVYRGEDYPSLQGKYFFADYCSNDIGILHEDNALEWVAEQPGVYFTGFGEDNNKELYAFGSGKIYRITGETLGTSEIQSPQISIGPNPAQEFISVKGITEFEEIRVFSIDGKLLKSSEGLEIGIQDLKPGMYILQIHCGNKYYSYKFIKK